ncbi:uncharacterized protein JCM15063_003624 [Sporobolomyces koalae]|uniref:uncharacterized protein n=1 Tax=Sporobolomyces koalae TaxID=500713 RepID=UPI00316F4FAB
MSSRLAQSTSQLLRWSKPIQASRRFTSTRVQRTEYTPVQWIKKFVPIEAYPLILLASSMCTYGVYHLYSRIVHVPGELRLWPRRYTDSEPEPWEQDRAQNGVW